MIHPKVEDALEEIDAAVFTGDPTEIRESLTHYMGRWQRALDPLGSEGCPVDDGGECNCGKDAT